MKNFFDNIPNYMINSITMASFFLMLVPIPIEFLMFYWNQLDIHDIYIIHIILMLMMILILFIRIWKYHCLLKNRMKIVSREFADFLSTSQNMYFEIMKAHKKDNLTIEWLTSTYKDRMILILNNLCEIMQVFTCREVSACIKLINAQETDLNHATVTTFCRSQNSSYRDKENEPVLIKDNTDFQIIVAPKEKGDDRFFYCENLKKYDELLRKSNQRYKNTNPNYDRHYIGTIVVPICIENDKLYDNNNVQNKYNIIGFLCVDSKAKDAFTKAQKTYNINIVKAFADNIYVLMGQYAHYLKGFTREKAEV